MLDINFVRKNDQNGAWANAPWCNGQGVMCLGDWAVQPVQAISSQRGVTVAAAAGEYAAVTLGLAASSQFIQTDLEGSSALMAGYAACIAAIRARCPHARVGVWLDSPNTVRAWLPAVTAADHVVIAAYQQKPESNQQAADDAVRCVADTKAALKAAGVLRPVYAELSWEIGWAHPDWAEASRLCTTGNLIARRRALSEIAGDCAGVFHWSQCPVGDDARWAALNHTAAALSPVVADCQFKES